MYNFYEIKKKNFEKLRKSQTNLFILKFDETGVILYRKIQKSD